MTRNQNAFAILDLLLHYGLITVSFLEGVGLKVDFLNRLMEKNMVFMNHILLRGQNIDYFTFGAKDIRNLMKYHRALASATQIKCDDRRLSTTAKQVQQSLQVMTEYQLRDAIENIQILLYLEWSNVCINPHRNPYMQIQSGQTIYTTIDDMSESYRLWAYMEGYGEFSSTLMGFLENACCSILVYNLTSKMEGRIYFSPESDHQVIENWYHDTRYKHLYLPNSEIKKINRSCIFGDFAALREFLEHMEMMSEHGERVPEMGECFFIPQNRETCSYLQMLFSGVITQRSLEIRCRKNVHLPREIFYRCDGHEPFDYADRNKMYIADLCAFDLGKLMMLRRMEKRGEKFGLLIEPWQSAYLENGLFNEKHPYYYLYGSLATLERGNVAV